MSAVALVSVWWWLRALVRPATAAAAALLLGVGPVFWGYGAMAGNYTAIVAGRCVLAGGRDPRASPARSRGIPSPRRRSWPSGPAIGPTSALFWLPVFLVILWQHRWKRAILAGVGLRRDEPGLGRRDVIDCGGWERYRRPTADLPTVPGR